MRPRPGISTGCPPRPPPLPAHSLLVACIGVTSPGAQHDGRDASPLGDQRTEASLEVRVGDVVNRKVVSAVYSRCTHVHSTQGTTIKAPMHACVWRPHSCRIAKVSSPCPHFRASPSASLPKRLIASVAPHTLCPFPGQMHRRQGNRRPWRNRSCGHHLAALCEAWVRESHPCSEEGPMPYRGRCRLASRPGSQEGALSAWGKICVRP